MTKTQGKIIVDPEIGEVLIVKSSRSRSISIRVHPVRGVRVSVPRLVPYATAIAFFKMKRGWVLEVMAKQKERFKDMLRINEVGHTVVQDRSIFEGVYVFVTNNYKRGDLSERDYQTYMELFDHMKRLMKMPDLMIYLRKSVPSLIAQIQKRGRDYEKTMQLDYLRDLNERYEDFIFNQYEGRVLVIESDDLDFESNPEDFRKVINKIDAELFGLFSAENF